MRGLLAARSVFVAASVVIVAVVVAPVLVVAAGSFWSAPFIRLPGNLTLQNYVKFLTDPETLPLVWTTVRMTFAASTIAVVVGGFLAWIIGRTDVPFRRVLTWLPVTPLLLSGLLRDTSWVALYSPRTGLVNQALMDVFNLQQAPLDIFTFGGVVVTMGLTLAPLPYLILLAPLTSIDPSLEEASRASGASTIRTLFRITAPMLLPALLSGLTVTAIIVATAFETPVIIGRPGGVRVFMSQIYSTMTSNDFSLASAQSMIALALIAILLWWYLRATKSEARFAVLGGKASQATRFQTGRWRWVLFGVVVLYFLVCFVQLFAVAVFLSLVPYFTTTESGIPPMSLNHYREAFDYPGTTDAILNSLLVAGQAAILAVTSAFILAFISLKTRIRGRRYAELIGTTPLAFPPLVFSVAVLLTFLSIPGLQSFYDTSVLMLIALLVVFLPYSVRVMSSALISINDELLEASAASGAGMWGTIRRVLAPLLGPAFLNAAAIVFVLAFRELGAIALVVPPGKNLLTAHIFGLWNSGVYGSVYALNVVSFLITGVALTLLGVALLLVRRGRGRSTVDVSDVSHSMSIGRAAAAGYDD
jgi:iron(III) transport system permease protein